MGDTSPSPAGGISANLFAADSSTKAEQHSAKGNPTFPRRTSSLRVRCFCATWATPMFWAGSISAIFLRSLLRARIFGQGYTDINDLTDDFIKNRHFNLVGGRNPVSFHDALADVKRKVRPDVSEPDARLRILMFQTSYLELCERRGWTFVEKAPKAAIKNLVAVLQPPPSSHELKTLFFWRRTILRTICLVLLTSWLMKPKSARSITLFVRTDHRRRATVPRALKMRRRRVCPLLRTRVQASEGNPSSRIA